MKTFIKYDYYTQVFVAVSFLIILVTDLVAFEKGYSWIAYFVLAAFHTVSFSIKLFMKKYVKSTSFKIYSSVSITILISLLLIVLFDNVEFVTDIFGFILMFGIPFTPVLAICYLIIIHSDYEKLFTKND